MSTTLEERSFKPRNTPITRKDSQSPWVSGNKQSAAEQFNSLTDLTAACLGVERDAQWIDVGQRPAILPNRFAEIHIVAEFHQSAVRPVQSANGAGSNQPAASQD